MTLLFERPLSYYTLEQPGKYLSRLCHYVDSLVLQRDYALSRVQSNAVSNANGFKLLERVISEADPDTLLTLSDDTSVYIDGLKPIASSLNRLFDQVTMAHGLNTAFIKNSNGQPCREYILAVSPPDAISTYPFGGGWDAWKSMRTLRLADIDSPELTFSVFYDQIIFRNFPAKRAVFTLDAILLVLQYIQFRKWEQDNKRTPMEIVDYLHQYVIIPCLQNDILDNWLLKLYARILRDDAGLMSPMDSYWESANYGRIGGQYNQAVEEVSDLATLLNSNQIVPCRFFSSLRLGDKSVNAGYHDLSHNVSVPSLIQYMWTNILISKPWNDILFHIVRRSNIIPEFKTLKSVMRSDVQIILASRPWGDIRDPILQGEIMSSIDQWKNMFVVPH